MNEKNKRLLLLLVITLFLYCNTYAAEGLNQKISVQRFQGDQGWEIPVPEPDNMQLKRWTGTYDLKFSDSICWDTSQLKIVSLKSMPVKDIHPHIKIKAGLTIPMGWENDDTFFEFIDSDWKLHTSTDYKGNKNTKVESIKISIDVNLKKHGHETYVFQCFLLKDKSTLTGTCTRTSETREKRVFGFIGIKNKEGKLK